MRDHSNLTPPGGRDSLGGLDGELGFEEPRSSLKRNMPTVFPKPP